MRTHRESGSRTATLRPVLASAMLLHKIHPGHQRCFPTDQYSRGAKHGGLGQAVSLQRVDHLFGGRPRFPVDIRRTVRATDREPREIALSQRHEAVLGADRR